jgi:hypothetical protein
MNGSAEVTATNDEYEYRVEIPTSERRLRALEQLYQWVSTNPARVAAQEQAGISVAEWEVAVTCLGAVIADSRRSREAQRLRDRESATPQPPVESP